MSVFNRRFIDAKTKEASPAHIMSVGPRIQIEISVPASLVAQLVAQGKGIPPPITGYGLIDTGASILCVDEGILQKLNLTPFSTANLSTPNGDKPMGIYPVSISFPGTGFETIKLARCVGADLTTQTKPPLNTIALIGRDILSKGVFIYDGKHATFTLAD
jgi:predicted aspartyl protease